MRRNMNHGWMEVANALLVPATDNAKKVSAVLNRIGE
jgi:hypothetical protein